MSGRFTLYLIKGFPNNTPNHLHTYSLWIIHYPWDWLHHCLSSFPSVWTCIFLQSSKGLLPFWSWKFNQIFSGEDVCNSDGSFVPPFRLITFSSSTHRSCPVYLLSCCDIHRSGSRKMSAPLTLRLSGLLSVSWSVFTDSVPILVLDVEI